MSQRLSRVIGLALALGACKPTINSVTAPAPLLKIHKNGEIPQSSRPIFDLSGIEGAEADVGLGLATIPLPPPSPSPQATNSDTNSLTTTGVVTDTVYRPIPPVTELEAYPLEDEENKNVYLGIYFQLPVGADFAQIFACDGKKNQEACSNNPDATLILVSRLSPKAKGKLPRLAEDASGTSTGTDTAQATQGAAQVLQAPDGSVPMGTILWLPAGTNIATVMVRTGRYEIKGPNAVVKWSLTPDSINYAYVQANYSNTQKADLLGKVMTIQLALGKAVIEFKRSYLGFAAAANACVVQGGTCPLTQEQVARIQLALDAPPDDYLAWLFESLDDGTGKEDDRTGKTESKGWNIFYSAEMRPFLGASAGIFLGTLAASAWKHHKEKTAKATLANVNFARFAAKEGGIYFDYGTGKVVPLFGGNVSTAESPKEGVVYQQGEKLVIKSVAGFSDFTGEYYVKDAKLFNKSGTEVVSGEVKIKGSQIPKETYHPEYAKEFAKKTSGKGPLVGVVLLGVLGGVAGYFSKEILLADASTIPACVEMNSAIGRLIEQKNAMDVAKSNFHTFLCQNNLMTNCIAK